jgi:hypothetical protein
MRPLNPDPSFRAQWEWHDVYREDLDDLVDLFRAAGYNVRIADGTHAYDSLDELRTRRGNRIAHLEIAALNNDKFLAEQASVEFNKFGGSAYASAQSGGLRLTLQRYIEERRRDRPFLAGWTIYIGSIVVLWGAPLLPGGNVGRVLGTVVGLVGMSLAMWGTFGRERHNAIRLTPRHEGGLLTQYRGEIVASIISGIVVAIATAIITLAVSKGPDGPDRAPESSSEAEAQVGAPAPGDG